MPDHVHLIIHPGFSPLPVRTILKTIKQPVGRRAVLYLAEHAPDWLPRISRTRAGRTERLFWKSGGGYDRNITEPDTLRQMIDYIHLNPVRRGFVERATAWKRSSARWFEQMPGTELCPDAIPIDWIGL
jgi:putative transposase